LVVPWLFEYLEATIPFGVVQFLQTRSRSRDYQSDAEVVALQKCSRSPCNPPVAGENVRQLVTTISIGCGACVAACKNASAMLFVSAKISHLALLPQGKVEETARVLNMVAKFVFHVFTMGHDSSMTFPFLERFSVW
jgi:ferredoxin